MQKGTITQEVALKKAEAPLREFMFDQTRDEGHRAVRQALGKIENVKTRKDVPTQVLIPAFIISELKTAFQIGFLIFLPFLIIDLVVSSTLMSMGMMMLPPVFISLPFKILLFILVDGWNLVTAVARSELPHVMTQDKVVTLIVDMMGVTMKVALPMLLVGAGRRPADLDPPGRHADPGADALLHPEDPRPGRGRRDRRPVDARHGRRLDDRSSGRRSRPSSVPDR